MTFTKIRCTVKYQGKIVLQDHKDVTTGLWMVNLQGSEKARLIAQLYIQAIDKVDNTIPKPPPEVELKDSFQLAAYLINIIIQAKGTKEVLNNLIKTSAPTKLAIFYLQVLCPLPKTMLLKVIKNK